MFGGKFGGWKPAADLVCRILVGRDVTPLGRFRQLQQFNNWIANLDMKSAVKRVDPSQDRCRIGPESYLIDLQTKFRFHDLGETRC